MFASASRAIVSRAALSHTRSIHSTPTAFKTVTEKVAQVADTVNKKVGQGLASAIETGENAAKTTKETLGSNAQAASKKTEEAAKLTNQKVNQAAAGAREAKRDFQQEVSK